MLERSAIRISRACAAASDGPPVAERAGVQALRPTGQAAGGSLADGCGRTSCSRTTGVGEATSLLRNPAIWLERDVGETRTERLAVCHRLQADGQRFALDGNLG